MGWWLIHVGAGTWGGDIPVHAKALVKRNYNNGGVTGRSTIIFLHLIKAADSMPRRGGHCRSSWRRLADVGVGAGAIVESRRMVTALVMDQIVFATVTPTAVIAIVGGLAGVNAAMASKRRRLPHNFSYETSWSCRQRVPYVRETLPAAT